jgi:hypothetical protein
MYWYKNKKKLHLIFLKHYHLHKHYHDVQIKNYKTNSCMKLFSSSGLFHNEKVFTKLFLEQQQL